MSVRSDARRGGRRPEGAEAAGFDTVIVGGGTAGAVVATPNIPHPASVGRLWLLSPRPEAKPAAAAAR